MDEREYLLRETRQHKSHRTQRKKRVRQNRTPILVCCFLLLIFGTVYGVALAADLIHAKDFLLQARENLRLAHSAAEKAEFRKAAEYFSKAKTNFINANKKLNSPSVKILSLVPMADDNTVALKRMTSSGLEISLGGEALLKAWSRFPQKQGKIDFSMSNGKIDIAPFVNARAYADEANLHILLAIAEYRKVPNGFMLSPIRKAHAELGQQLPKLKSLMIDMKRALDIIPSMMGSDGKRRYFLAVQNNAELRATGGLIGNYGIITVDNGKFSLEAFDEIHKLQKKDQRPVKAPEDFVARYGRFKGTSRWINANMSPDFPTVGGVLVELYKSTTGVKLDGVISVDPVSLKYILAATGPVKLPGEPIEVGADNVVDWTLVDAYATYTEREERKDFLADVAMAVWSDLTSGRIEDKSGLVNQLKLALSEQHIAIFSIHEKEQELVEKLGYGGALIPTTGDYLQVLMQNHGGNKVDTYIYEEIDYSVALKRDGSSRAKVSARITNKTPASGLPEYVTGEHLLGVKGGYSNTWLNIYAPKGAHLVSAKEGTKTCEVEVGSEKDKTVFSQYLKVAPGASRRVDYTFDLPYTVIFNGNETDYVLDWQAQPVINKPDITLSITPPEGFEFARVPLGFTRKDKGIFHVGTLDKDERFEVSLVEYR